MKTIDIILIVALSLWVVFSIAYVVVNRKKGKLSLIHISEPTRRS